MKFRRFAELFVIFPLLLVFINFTWRINAQDPTRGSQTDFDQLRKEYTNLGDDWRKKRAFCMDLIDRRVIRQTNKLRPILSIFGSDVEVVSGKPEAECTALVFFEKQPQLNLEIPIENRPAVKSVGWYLFVETNEFGQVIQYFLSNLNK